MKQIAIKQGILNDRLALGYGATSLAGLFHSINQLQQNMSGQNLTMGQAQSSQGGVPARFVPADRNHEGPIQNGIKEFRWQAGTSKGDKFEDYNLKNQERILKTNAAGVDSSENRQLRMNSKGIMTDTVGSRYNYGKDYNRTKTTIVGNTVYWNGTPYPMTTEFKQVIQFSGGVPAKITSEAIEPSHPDYVKP
jgi:hypothetical protein